MIFEIDDDNLVRQVQQLIDAHNEKKAKTERIERMSYEDRVAEFLYSNYSFTENAAIGLSSWYDYKKLPARNTFHPKGLSEYFADGEAVPCFMRGSLHSMKMKYQAGWGMPHDIAMRFIKRIKVNCTNPDEWRDLLSRDYASSIIKRIEKKWSRNAATGLRPRIDYLVREFKGGRNVLVDGVEIMFEEEKLKLLDILMNQYKKLQVSEIKFDKVMQRVMTI